MLSRCGEDGERTEPSAGHNPHPSPLCKGGVLSFNALRSSAASLRGPLDVEGSLFLPPRSPFFLITKSASFFKNKRGRFSPTFHTLGLLGPKYFLKMQASRALMPKYWRQSIGGVSGWDFWRMSVSGTFDQGFYGPGCAAEAGPFFQNRRPKKQILSQKQISWPRGPVKHSTRIFGVEYFFPLQL